MKKGLWIVLALIAVLALSVFAAACGGSTETTTAAPATTATTAPPTTAATAPPTTAASTPATTATTVANTTPLKFGIALSLTGDSAAPCTQIKEGFDTEVKYINANGGINGRQVQLIYIDDQSKMDTAQTAVQSLIDQKVDVIIGPFPQQCQPPARELAEKAGVFMVGFGPPTMAEVNEDQSKYTYTFSPATGVDGCADAFIRELQADGRKNVLGIGDQIPMSGETLRVLNVALPKLGITFTMMNDTWGLGETDLTPIANKIVAKAKEVKPDAIVLCSNPVHINVICKDLRALGVTVPVYNEGAGSHPLPMFAGAGNDPANVAGNYAIGPAIVDPTKIPDSYPAKADLTAYIQRWQADNPKEPFASLFLGFPYDTIHLAELAIKTAATPDWAGYAAAMMKIDWWGAQGHYVFSPTDHIGNHGGFFQWQYTNGQGFKLVRDLNAMEATSILPETDAAVKSFK